MPDTVLSDLSDPELLRELRRATTEFTTALQPFENNWLARDPQPADAHMSLRLASATAALDAVGTEINQRIRKPISMVTDYHDGEQQLHAIPDLVLAEIKGTNTAFFSSLHKQEFTSAHHWGTEFLRLALDCSTYDPAATSLKSMVPNVKSKLEAIDAIR
jgi:hypothetical protein